MEEKTIEYEKICLSWSIYEYLITNLVDDGVIEGFISAYGLNNKKCLDIAKKENIEVRKEDLGDY